MKIEELSFPVTLEAFVAYQEALMGRELDVAERDVIQVWLPVLNDCYDQRAKGTAGAMGERLDQMEVFLAQAEGDAVVVHILKCMRRWMCYAYQQGQKDAEKEVDRL